MHRLTAVALCGLFALAPDLAAQADSQVVAKGKKRASSTQQQSPTSPPWYKLDGAQLAREIARSHRDHQDIADRLFAVSSALLRARFVRSPLGEGQGQDADPRFRLDAFDCTTFVETVTALSLSSEVATIRRVLDKIRYKRGKPVFTARRHLALSQWIPGLNRAGILQDITAAIGGDQARWITVKLTANRWRNRRVARTLKLDLSDIPIGTHRLPYLPLAFFLNHEAQVPSGTILSVVHADSSHSPDPISHQGLLFRKPSDGRLYMRHASQIYKRVIDEALEWVVRRYRKPRKWRVLGFNLQRVRAVETLWHADQTDCPWPTGEPSDSGCGSEKSPPVAEPPRHWPRSPRQRQRIGP
ncbi:MAG: DUF1460 domain-containing protein [Deltaproteobacteria bacterium]|nr:DUF1460 domain-containing protein [Deltaproteobacteria bacterium]